MHVAYYLLLHIISISGYNEFFSFNDDYLKQHSFEKPC